MYKELTGGVEMRQQLFVVGDIHGEYDMLVKLLEQWDKKTQTLLFVGDLADRGLNSKACIELVYRLVAAEDAICLTGNHEQLFLQFLEQPDTFYGNYLINGGASTISSLLPDLRQSTAQPTEIAEKIKDQYPDLIAFISSMPLYFEWHHYLFVHAGVDLSLPDWKETPTKDFYWIREPFHRGINQTGKVIVFGHTPTPGLHNADYNYDIWESDNKIGIDGGAVFGGILHGLVFDQNTLVAHYGVQKKNDVPECITYIEGT